MADGYDSNYRSLVSQAVQAGTLRPLLAYVDFFPVDATRIYLAYAESVSAVDFMVRKYGQAAVARIVKTYQTGATDDEAFKAGIGVDMATFNTAWLASIGGAGQVRATARTHGRAARPEWTRRRVHLRRAERLPRDIRAGDES